MVESNIEVLPLEAPQNYIAQCVSIDTDSMNRHCPKHGGAQYIKNRSFSRSNRSRSSRNDETLSYSDSDEIDEDEGSEDDSEGEELGERCSQTRSCGKDSQQDRGNRSSREHRCRRRDQEKQYSRHSSCKDHRDKEHQSVSSKELQRQTCIRVLEEGIRQSREERRGQRSLSKHSQKTRMTLSRSPRCEGSSIVSQGRLAQKIRDIFEKSMTKCGKPGEIEEHTKGGQYASSKKVGAELVVYKNEDFQIVVRKSDGTLGKSRCSCGASNQRARKRDLDYTNEETCKKKDSKCANQDRSRKKDSRSAKEERSRKKDTKCPNEEKNRKKESTYSSERNVRLTSRTTSCSRSRSRSRSGSRTSIQQIRPIKVNQCNSSTSIKRNSKSSIKRISQIKLSPCSCSKDKMPQPPHHHHHHPQYKMTGTSTSFNDQVQTSFAQYPYGQNMVSVINNDSNSTVLATTNPTVNQANACNLCQDAQFFSKQCPIPVNNQCPIPIKIGNFEQMVNPDEKFKVKMFFYTGKPGERRPPGSGAKCKRCKPKRASRSGSCMESTKETCDLDAFLAGQADKSGKKDKEKKGKKGKEKEKPEEKKDKENKEEKKEEEKKEEEKKEEEKKEEEKKEEEKKEENKEEEEDRKEEKEEVKSPYKRPRLANLEKDIVFKSIKEIAPENLGRHIVIKSKTPVRRNIHDMVPKDWSPQFINPKTPNRLPKSTPFCAQPQNNIDVNPNPIQPIQESYSINHVQTVHVADLARAPNKKHSYSRPKISTIIKNFENKLFKRFGKWSSVSTGKDKSYLPGNFGKTDTLKKITEEFGKKGKSKEEINEDRTESRELASILMIPDEEKRRETCTQTSALHTVPEVGPEKINIANQTSIETTEQIESNNQLESMRSIYSKFKKHDSQEVNNNQYPRSGMKNLAIDSKRFGVTGNVCKQPIEIKEIVDALSEDESEEAMREKPFIGESTRSVSSLDKVIRDLKELKRIYKMFEGNMDDRNENATSSSRVKTLANKKFEFNDNDATKITRSVDRDKIRGSMKFGQGGVEGIRGSAPSSMIRYDRQGNVSLTRHLNTYDKSFAGTRVSDQQISIKNITKTEPVVKQIAHKKMEKPKQASKISYISETMDLYTCMPRIILERSHGISNSISEEKETNIREKKINKGEMGLCKYIPSHHGTGNETTSSEVGTIEIKDTYLTGKSSKDDEGNENTSLSTYQSKHTHTNEKEIKLRENSSDDSDSERKDRKQIISIFKSKHIHTDENDTNLKEKDNYEADKENEDDKVVTVYQSKFIPTNESHTNIVQNKYATKCKESITSKQSIDNLQSHSTKQDPKIRLKDQAPKPQGNHKSRKNETDQTVTIFKDVANMILESCLGLKENDSKKIDYIDHLLAFFDRTNPGTSRQYNSSTSQMIITDLEDDFDENVRNEVSTSGSVEPMQTRQDEQRALEHTIDKIIPIITSNVTNVTISVENAKRMHIFKTIETRATHLTNFEKLKDIFENQSYAIRDESASDRIKLYKLKDRHTVSVEEGSEEKAGHKTEEPHRNV